MLEEMYDHNAAAQGEQKATEIQGAVYGTLSSYEAEGILHCTKMPGCLEALDWVKERGIPMGYAPGTLRQPQRRRLERKV